jgi:hypothetical protein
MGTPPRRSWVTWSRPAVRSVPLAATIPPELDWVEHAVETAITNAVRSPEARRETPGPDPDDIPSRLFKDVIRDIVHGVDLAEIERRTELSHRKVSRIRDWWDHPEQPGPSGGPGYHLEPGRNPGTVRLRKL